MCFHVHCSWGYLTLFKGFHQGCVHDVAITYVVFSALNEFKNGTILAKAHSLIDQIRFGSTASSPCGNIFSRDSRRESNLSLTGQPQS